ncbi:GNAT family N-acetyltransferase [Lentzea tibetensis]|uniref:GNAT family N-acetyltransferase n=1 Tax=Lentzea tibetensis TaxID=2591470 RepID=A0A563EJC5_9PSEU|nr:GNAT family N-acetyltransferase [Lentzea tibetensis]TWP46859.1 GNAT family N-acetyltransferase [Lentzea tibetensis]
MTEIRVLDESQYRDHHTLFRGTLHHAAAPDEVWEHARNSYEPGRSHAAFDGAEIVGTVQSFGSSLVLPGGAVVPHAAVSRVGVRADHTRRGVLSSMMRAQFDALDEPAATLRASEGVIYGRFGYGVATRGRTVRVDRRRAAVPGEATGRVRLVDRDTAGKLLPELHDSVGMKRPGAIGRWTGWWELNLFGNIKPDDNLVSAVHSGPDGDDGFVVYKVDHGDKERVLKVYDLCAASPAAWADLWRYLIGIDLVDEVEAWLRPLDEPLEWLFTDPRAVKVTEFEDETWLRLIDVPFMLAQRTYADGDPVVVGVTDRLIPVNTGSYLITPDGASRTDQAPDVELSVDLLGALYLGDTTFRQLVTANRATGSNPAAADRLFAVSEVPWCGTYF